MREVLIATGNRGKLREMSLLLRPFAHEIKSLADFPEAPEVVEDGHSFRENAILKALSAARFTGMPTVADDSGLEVEALDGAPGVFSARFAGEGATDEANNAKLLSLLDGVPRDRRAARFVCAIAFCQPDGGAVTFEGELRGTVLSERRGEGGFGYDPLFLVAEYGKTLAELSMEVKNRISHRAVALSKLIEYLKKNGKPEAS